MRILLLGEYSNVHWTLAEGLRALGHEAVVVSDGDGWKQYPRHVDLRRRSTGRWHTLRYLWDVHRTLGSIRGYDVVQIINPMFLELRAERIWPYYEQLRRGNGRIIMAAYGMDHYWVRAGMDCTTFRYSDFNIGAEPRQSEEIDQWKREWLDGPKGLLNRRIAEDCDGIVAGLYEYYASYQPHFPAKTCFIPFPIHTTPPAQGAPTQGGGTGCPSPADGEGEKVRFFIGIQRTRNAYKGTDIMLRALLRLEERYPERVEVRRAENVPFQQYRQMMADSDVLLDQLYGYTPAMNALQAMSQGLVTVGGGEPEGYDLLGEQELRPIVNVLPSEESVFSELEQLVLHPERIPLLKQQGLQYVARHHDYRVVAQRYLDFYRQV